MRVEDCYVGMLVRGRNKADVYRLTGFDRAENAWWGVLVINPLGDRGPLPRDVGHVYVGMCEPYEDEFDRWVREVREEHHV
jgi:hypothetical protein